MAISRVSNIIRVLAAHSIPLSDELLVEVYGWALEREEAGDVDIFLPGDDRDALVTWFTGRRPA
jgi:exosome complex component RRP4